jgi:hypothetical protein
MISKTSWNRILYIATGLVVMVVVIIIFYIIPQVKAAPNATPERAVPAFLVIVLIHILIVATLMYSVKFSHREGHFENGFLVTAGVVMILSGLVLIDAASASLGDSDLHGVAISLFICIGFDFFAGVLSIISRYFRGHLRT